MQTVPPVRETTASPRCPRCGGVDTRRSPRRGFERLISILALLPFRCEDCNQRFLTHRRTSVARS